MVVHELSIILLSCLNLKLIKDIKMKLLYITSLSGKRINGFMRSAILAAKELNIDFTMACNMDMADKDGYKQDCEIYGIKVIHVDFDRNPLSKKNVVAYKQLSKIIRGGGMMLYIVIHQLVAY